MNEVPIFEVSGAIAVFNQIIETATPLIVIVGEIANFKINQNKWVFFDIKDAESTLNCFMPLSNLRGVVEDGMRVEILARPGITKWGKFSLTIQNVKPIGAGSIKRAFELLRAKLEKEGLFAVERKRTLPELPTHIGVISSTGAAGYVDFIKILNERMTGISVDVAHVQVQGDGAADQIIAALQYFNGQKTPPEVVVILRGGGSRDDLIAFDDERLVREIALSRAPILTGIGHEIDTTLADLVADVRAATPSNAAQILVPDRREIVSMVDFQLNAIINDAENRLNDTEARMMNDWLNMAGNLDQIIINSENKLRLLNMTLQQLNPRAILRRGYAIVRDGGGKILRGGAKIGETLTIENDKIIIKAEVKNVSSK